MSLRHTIGLCAGWQLGLSGHTHVCPHLQEPTGLCRLATTEPRCQLSAASLLQFAASCGRRQQHLGRSRAVQAVTCLVYYLEHSYYGAALLLSIAEH